MSGGLLNVVLLVPVFLFSLCVHEYAHAWVATKRGDPTPAMAGRLSLHPMAHADIIGTLLLPIICIYNGWPFFGWAKPVPVDMRYMKYGRRDMALVAIAGPVSNILLALVSTAVLAVLVNVPIPLDAKILETVQIFSVVSIQVNLMLALFNLLPIPPLDGFNVVQGFMSARVATQFYRMVPMANVLLLILLVSGGLQYLAIPASIAFRYLITLAGVT